MKTKIVSTVDDSNDELKELVSRLKRIKFVHSIILFGSLANGTQRAQSDVDLCIITKPDSDVSLKQRIALNNSVPESIDISLLRELPVYICKRIFREGKVLYTEDLYYILTLSKENDLEYARYQRMKIDYHRNVMERVRLKLR
jgi:predicted nucleotidyltransferase